MGEPPRPGEEQEVSVSISGPARTAAYPQVEAFEQQFRNFKAAVKKLRGEYADLKVKVSKIAYTKKDPNESFE